MVFQNSSSTAFLSRATFMLKVWKGGGALSLKNCMYATTERVVGGWQKGYVFQPICS